MDIMNPKKSKSRRLFEVGITFAWARAHFAEMLSRSASSCSTCTFWQVVEPCSLRPAEVLYYDF
jgi:hypothetical protein